MSPYTLSTLIVSAFAAAACQSTPRINSELNEARNSVMAVSMDPAVQRGAPLQLQQAREALRDAEFAARRDGNDSKTRSMAYIATQRAAIARATGERWQSEQRAENFTRSREQQRAAEAQAQAQSATAQVQNAQQTLQAKEAQIAELRRQTNAERERSLRLQEELGAVAVIGGEGQMVFMLSQDGLFENNDDVIPGKVQNTLAPVVTLIEKAEGQRVRVQAFTDNQGSDEANLERSQRRAESLKRALISQGVAADRIDSRGYGKAYPVADNSTEIGRQRNRRIEIVFSDAGGTFATR